MWESKPHDMTATAVVEVGDMGTPKSYDDEPLEDEVVDSDYDDESADEDYEDGEQIDGVYSKTLVRRKFDEIIANLISGALDLEKPDNLANFMRQYQADLPRSSSPKDQTLLHLLAEASKADLPIKKIRGLVRELVRLPANLLAQLDADDKTPLYCAIALRNHRLAKTMCEAHDDIDSILRRQTKRTPNCLHRAIRNKYSARDDDLIEFIIGLAGPETLCAPDENGLAPLHLAVDYSRCDEAQPRIVRALVDKCERAALQTYDHRDKGPLSPYRYHELTYQEAKEREHRDRALREAKKRSEQKDGVTITTTAITNGIGGPGDPLLNGLRSPVTTSADNLLLVVKAPTMQRPKMQADLLAPTLALSVPRRSVPVHLEAPTGKFGAGPAKASMAETPRLRPRRGGSETPVPADAGRTKHRGAKSARVKASETAHEEIRKFLKLFYLRTQKYEQAVEFLYGAQQDREIFFDLVGYDPVISQSQLDGFKHLVFEEFLQYVAFPTLRFEQPAAAPGRPLPKASPHSGGPSSAIGGGKADGIGRSDLQMMFQWLRDKKVKTILKVIVDDLEEPAHSDEAIETCLRGLGVEVWDWMRMDLSSDVIVKAAPDVREVHLHWSGNNGVLRGWSAPDGLNQLKSLKTVYLHIHQGLETRSRRMEYVNAFKERLQATSKIEVKAIQVRGPSSDGSSSPNGTYGGGDAPRERNDLDKWMAAMTEFAEFLQTAERHAEPPVVLPQPVVVAVIDDGVDTNNQSVHSKIVGGRTFCRRDNDQNLNESFFVSSSGHGTAMAELICRVCPDVRLFVLKLDEHVGREPGKREITAKSAAKAVRAAVGKKVDIISMSWTVKKTDDNKDDIAELEKAIELAASKNILMFCAASDQVAYKDRSYPAAVATRQIFKIGAAEATGNGVLKWPGDQSAVDFIFPGHPVPVIASTHRRRSSANGYGASSPAIPGGGVNGAAAPAATLTGSSVATALATALAAVILHCVQLGAVWRARGRLLAGALDEYAALKNHERMSRALTNIGTTKESEHKFITVWNRFSKTVRRSENMNAALKDEWIGLVADLADDLKRED